MLVDATLGHRDFVPAEEGEQSRLRVACTSTGRTTSFLDSRQRNSKFPDIVITLTLGIIWTTSDWLSRNRDVLTGLAGSTNLERGICSTSTKYTHVCKYGYLLIWC